MHYEINISKNGRHYFATAERSIQTKAQLDDIYSTLEKAFPESEGYELSVTYYKTVGELIDMGTEQ